MIKDYSKLTHIKTYGSISYICYPQNEDEVFKAYLYAEKNSLKPFPLGGGSNTLIGHSLSYFIISDINLKRVWEYESDIEVPEVTNSDTLNQKNLIISSNTNVSYLIMRAAMDGFGGLEFLAGLPAHLGGIVTMNAGNDGQTISDFLEWITIVDKDGEKKIYKKDIDFQYRHSNINGFITKVCVKLFKNDFSNNREINKTLHQKMIKQQIIDRKRVQPIDMPNLGCFFKNPRKFPAGLLIEAAGLKGLKIGGAMVSQKHANFLINTGEATFEDFILLIDRIKETVIEKFNIALELEIRIVNG